MCKPAAFPSSARGNHRRQRCRAANALSEQQNLGELQTGWTPFRAVSDNRYQYKEAAGLAAAAAKSVAGNRCPDRNSASGTSSCTRQRDKDFQRGLKILCTCSPGYVSGPDQIVGLAATDMCHQEQMRWGSHRRSRHSRQRDRQAYALGRSVDRAVQPGTCAGTQVVGGSFFGSLMLAQDCDAGPTNDWAHYFRGQPL